MKEEVILKINQVIAEFFKQNPHEASVPAKDLMPHFIKAGIFIKDEKNGLPIRKILRNLDAANNLNDIPFVHPVRKEANTYWYFVRNGAEYIPKEVVPLITKSQAGINKRVTSDEFYILDLCDNLLNQKSSRQHTFDFVLGDLYKDGKSRTKLPFDAYYMDLNLVIEFCERQHTEEVAFFDKPDKKTVSGVSRGEQRKIYDKRKREALKENNILLVDIDHSLFECNRQKKLVRNEAKDIDVLKGLLINWMK